MPSPSPTRRVTLLALLTALSVACAPRAEPPPTPPSRPAVQPRATDTPPTAPTPEADRDLLVARGAHLVEAAQCNRCHDGLPSGPAPRDKHCVHCHQQIHDRTFEQGDVATQDRWRAHIIHLRAVPSLADLGERLRPDWIAGYLRAPVDLRPRLDATMPRFAFTDADTDAIAAFLTRDASPTGPAPTDGDPANGLRLLLLRRCTICHAYSGADLPPINTTGPVPCRPDQCAAAFKLAPDLRHTRDRFRRDRLDAWLRDPAAMHPGTLMPRLTLTDAERHDLVAALLRSPLTREPEAAPIPTRLPVLTRAVGWDEVERRVFKTVCWHCHADPELADGDGGPGNTGGLGFPGRGVSFATYDATLAGRRNDDGRRQSLFDPTPDGTPRLVAVLMARHAEVAGQPVDGLRGMPLGLPPMSLEQIQLVETWIAQGRPR